MEEDTEEKQHIKERVAYEYACELLVNFFLRTRATHLKLRLLLIEFETPFYMDGIILLIFCSLMESSSEENDDVEGDKLGPI